MTKNEGTLLESGPNCYVWNSNAVAQKKKGIAFVICPRKIVRKSVDRN